MSTTDGRRERIQRILKVMENSTRPLAPNEIAAKTQILTEIQMDRLYKYLAELEWCGMVIRVGNTYTVNPRAPLKVKRERERERKREHKRERE